MLKHNSNMLNFNVYVFLSTFARNLIEVFVGVVLLKRGFPLHDVILFYLLIYGFSVFLCFVAIQMSKKFSNILVGIIGILAFISLQIILNFSGDGLWYIIVCALIYSIYRRVYWGSRRYFTLQVVDDKNISKQYSFLVIVNQLGIVTAAYIGSLLLQFLDISIVTAVSISLLVLSIFFMSRLKFKNEHSKTKLHPIRTIKMFPKSSMVHIGCYELQNVIKYLLSLFLIIYVRDTYTTIGVVHLIANIATIVFIYIYGRLINKKRNYLKLSIIFIILVFVLQTNTTGVALMIASFLQGFAEKMYDQSFNKEMLTLSKKFDYYNFNLIYELTQNIFRFLAVAFIFFFVHDIKVMIYMMLAFLSIALFFKFRTTISKK